MSKIYNYPDAKGLIFCGDIHGEFEKIIHKICNQYLITDSVIIFAGDCGFGFYKENYYHSLYQHVLAKLSHSNNWLVFIRGNHDDPSFFQEEKIKYDRFRCVPDYSIISACNHNVLCIGGGISIDRQDRLQYKNLYWANEAPIYDEANLVSLDRKIDIVVSHTAPSFCPPLTKDGIRSWLMQDNALEDDLTNERETFDKVFLKLKELNHPLSKWYYGHFHFTNRMDYDNVVFRLLDIDELVEEYPTN